MAFRPRLLTMSQLAAQQLSVSAPPRPISPTPTATFAQNCVICNGRHNLQKLFGAPLRILREKGIVEEELEDGCKTVCDFCSIKLKRVFTYQKQIKTLERKILETVEELKVKANWRSELQIIQDERDEGPNFENFEIQVLDVETILDNSDGEEVEIVEFVSRAEVQNVDPFLDNFQTTTNEQPANDNQQQQKLTPDLTAEDVVMTIELLALANEPNPLINVPDANKIEIEEDLVIKCEFEPEDVEVMPMSLQEGSSSPQLPNSECDAVDPERRKREGEQSNGVNELNDSKIRKSKRSKVIQDLEDLETEIRRHHT